ncbi:MAG: DUF2125 domain-containing protein [Jhaorihella sp.]
MKILVVIGLLWSGYWYAAGYGLRAGVAGWFSAQQARGWQADYAGLSTSGYPLRHVNMLTGPALADPASGIAWQADWLMLESPAIWPGRQTLRFAPTPQRLSYFDRTAVIEAQDMVADLHLHPGIALELAQLSLTAGPWRVSGPGGTVLGGDGLTLAMVQTDRPDTYRYDIAAPGFAPGDGLRRMARATETLPPRFEALSVAMEITFDGPWDRRALEQRRPQPVAIDLRLADLRWGGLTVMAAGKLAVDSAGTPTGTISVKAEKWREMLDMARSAWDIPPGAMDSVERGLALLARMGRDPDALDLQLNLRDGFVALGPIPLGRAPRLILR